jgi:hypothetical protein
MTKLQKIILSGLLAVAICVVGFNVYKTKNNFGAISIPDAPYLFNTTLQAGISVSDISMSLTSGTLKDGTTLTGYQCFTIDTGSATAEYACGTASGTAISSLLRGINPLNPNATSSALIYAHRRGADVRITDFPILQITKRLVNGQDAFPNPLKYDSGVSTTTLQGSGSYLASVDYVNGVSVAGAANATTTAKGILQFATGSQVSNGTLQGSTGAFLVAPNWIFNSTPGSSTTVPVTLANGKLAQGFLDLTQNYIWTGAHSFSATTTLATTTIAGTLTVNGATTTLNNIILIPATPVATSSAANKFYVDNRFSYGNSTTTAINNQWTTVASTTIASLTVTPPIAGRLLVTANLSATGFTGKTCITALYIDKVFQASTSAVSVTATGDIATLNFSFMTSQQTASTHTIDLVGSTSQSCTLYSGPNFSVLNIGN